jgi:2-alkyl-3-oxoalkanoate reductase
MRINILRTVGQALPPANAALRQHPQSKQARRHTRSTIDNEWRGMTPQILLTGVSGFVGGALGAYLRQLGYDVIGVSRKAPRPNSVSRFLAHDLTEPIPASWPSTAVVVHCAALSSPWASPAAYQANNVGATRNLLAYAERAKARRFVFISSSSVYYAPGDQLGITEDSPFPLTPINQYAATKRQAEELVRRAAVPWAILRPRAVFGPGDTVLFPRILRAAKRGALPRMIRPDGKSPWADLIYIDNLSHYIERAVALDVSGSFNLTNNQPVELYPFLDGLLAKLSLPQPRKTVRVGTAMFFARLSELVSHYLLNYKEPPITRFGVEVMAYSKIFDVRKMVAAFGPPPVTIETGVDRFLEWQRTQWQSL